MDIMERKLLIEQVRKETLDNLKQYQVGLCRKGVIIAPKESKDSEDWDGFLFLIPEEKYKELKDG